MEFYLFYVAALGFIQNVAFTLVSRARNRDKFLYHAITSVLSNGIFFLTFRELVMADMTWSLFAPYLIGTVCGSLFGAKVAMGIEQAIGALADGVRS
ncbi:MAG: hypothetical protein M3H12_07800 [Chromatiales bacterium]|nr:DUF1145 domain-containing protein [Gammaproteobacteria bacterium]